MPTGSDTELRAEVERLRAERDEAQNKHARALIDEERLRAAIEDYSLWRPGEKGHAAAHRKLMEAIR